MDRYLSGQALYGDDLSLPEVQAWFRDEEEGYAGLDYADAREPVYMYHAQNERVLFRHLPVQRVFQRVLGIGSAFGEEFYPLRDRIRELVILDPSDSFVRPAVHGIPVQYRKPHASGRMEHADGSFDLITCLGVLHHIPNVTTVVREIGRSLMPGGYALIKEPIHSMGDWRRPRTGLTKHERGIPLDLFRRIVADAGLTVERETLTTFPLLPRVLERIGIRPYNSPVLTALDGVLCRVSAFNTRYHRTSVLHKLAPAQVAFVLRKP